MNLHTDTTGNVVRILVEDAQALMAVTTAMAGRKVENARKRLAAALESAKKIMGCGGENAVEISAICEGGRSGTDQTASRLQNLLNRNGGSGLMQCNWSGRSGWSSGRGHDESALMKSQLG